jgi:hypothetical protein
MKKKGFIILAAVLALSLIGVGYAAWTQSLTATATLNTGSYIINFAGSPTPSPTTGTGTITASASGLNMTVGLNTGYPGFSGTVNYTINNTGTIPAKVTSITLAAGTGVTIINPGPYSAGTLGDSQTHAWNITLPTGTSGTTDVQVWITGGITSATTWAASSGTASGVLNMAVPSSLATDMGGLTGVVTLSIGTTQNPS